MVSGCITNLVSQNNIIFYTYNYNYFMYSCTDVRSDLQASSARAAVSAQQRLRRCRRRAAASPGVRLRLCSFSTSRSADRPLSSRRPGWKHMVTPQINRGSQQSGLLLTWHHGWGTPHASHVFFCPPFSLQFKLQNSLFCRLEIHFH